MLLPRDHRALSISASLTALARRATSFPVAAALLVGAACAEDQASLPPAPATLEEAFVTAGVVEVGEDEADSIAEVGSFAERADGGFVIGDRLLPRVRTYDERGGLEAAFGKFGEGPWEFYRMASVGETAEGGIVVIGSKDYRTLHYFGPNLQPDTAVEFPGSTISLVPVGSASAVVLWMNLPGFREARTPQLHWAGKQGLGWSSYLLPYDPVERPYWTSLDRNAFAVAGDSVYATTSVMYPVTVLDAATGDSLGVLGTPAASFKPLPVFKYGQFADPSAYGITLAKALAETIHIDRVDVVSDYLILTLGPFDGPMSRRVVHTHLEVYNRHTGAKLYEDVQLPEGYSVLGGGRYLYMLLDKDFPPWRIARMTVVPRN